MASTNDHPGSGDSRLNGTGSSNGAGPRKATTPLPPVRTPSGQHFTPRYGAPALPPRDREHLDVFSSSSAADWNGAAPRPHAAPADELDVQVAPARPHNGKGLRGWFDRTFHRASPAEAPHEGDAHPDDGDANPGNGVHAITRTTDYWFEREIHGIEKSAREQAVDWATKGLPRHDVARTEPLEPEQVLAAHCAQLFRDWQRRVRTRMQDAIEEGSQAVGRQVATLRNAITRLEAIGSERTELYTRQSALKEQAAREAGAPVRYDAYIGRFAFWFGAVVLFLVEFFANFPVFRLLLPMSRALNTAAQAAAENVDDTSWLAGPQMLAREMSMHIEATVVALVAVFVLVLLGKTLGASLRPLLAFRAEDQPLAAQSIRAHQRQKGALALLCLAGLFLAVTFLYRSRDGIAGTAHERVQAESQHLDTLRARMSRLDRNDRTRIGQAAAEILVVENNKRFLEDDEAYARTVQKNNTPILYLNVALILCAMVLGYSHQGEDLTEKRGEHPEVARIGGRLSQIDREMYATLDEGRRAEGQAHAEIARVHHLLAASPLRDSRSKRQRLEGVIPLFRGENARLRGLDPANIRAFDLPATLDLPPDAPSEAFMEPAEFARLKGEFNQLSASFGRMAPRMTPALGQAIIAG